MNEWLRRITEQITLVPTNINQQAKLVYWVDYLQIGYCLGLITALVCGRIPFFPHIFICFIFLFLSAISFRFLPQQRYFTSASISLGTAWATITYILLIYPFPSDTTVSFLYIPIILYSILLLNKNSTIGFIFIGLIATLISVLFPGRLVYPLNDPQVFSYISIVNLIYVTGLIILALISLPSGYPLQKNLVEKNNIHPLPVNKNTSEYRQSETEIDILNQNLYYEALLTNNPLAIVTLDLNHNVIRINPAFHNLFGYTLEEAHGRNLDDLIVAADVQAQASQFTNRALVGQTVFGSGRRYTKDKRGIDVEVFGVPVFKGEKQVGIFAMYNDISARVAAEKALRTSEVWHRSLFENIPIALWEEDFSELKAFIEKLRGQGIHDIRSYLSMHPEEVEECAHMTRVINVNQATLDLYHAKDKDQLIGELDKVLGEKAYEVFKDEVATLAEGNLRYSTELFNRTLHGDTITIQLALSIPPGYESNWEKVLVSTNDITQRKKTERELQEAEARQRLVLESMPVLMLALGDDKLIKAWNNECTRTTGFWADEMINNPKALEFLFPDPNYRKKVLSEWLLKNNDLHDREIEIMCKDGSKKIIALSDISRRFPIRGWRSWSIGVDITARKAAEDQLIHMASHDPLTNLPNRSLFYARLSHAIDIARRNAQKIAVVFLDLNNFKGINDVYGHSHGDKLLVELSSRLTNLMRSSDTIARFGGDEFTCILENIHDAQDVRTIMEKILVNISMPFNIDGDLFMISASAGVSFYPDDGGEADVLLLCADHAMYDAKKNDKVGYLFYADISR